MKEGVNCLGATSLPPSINSQDLAFMSSISPGDSYTKYYVTKINERVYIDILLIIILLAGEFLFEVLQTFVRDQMLFDPQMALKEERIHVHNVETYVYIANSLLIFD